MQNAMPRLVLEGLRDTGSIGNFADSLGGVAASVGAPVDDLVAALCTLLVIALWRRWVG